MTPERWQQVKELFRSALEHKVEERVAFLDRACDGDDSLRQEVESLLAAEGEIGSFLAAGAMNDAAKMITEDEEGSISRVGETPGHYQLLLLLGAACAQDANS